jgi:hypothetical protein
MSDSTSMLGLTLALARRRIKLRSWDNKALVSLTFGPSLVLVVDILYRVTKTTKISLLR